MDTFRTIIAVAMILLGIIAFPYKRKKRHGIGLALGCGSFIAGGVLSLIFSFWSFIFIGIILGYLIPRIQIHLDGKKKGQSSCNVKLFRYSEVAKAISSFAPIPAYSDKLCEIVFGVSFEFTISVLDAVKDKDRKKFTQTMLLENRLYFIGFLRTLMLSSDISKDVTDDIIHCILRLVILEYKTPSIDKEEEYLNTCEICNSRIDEYNDCKNGASRSFLWHQNFVKSQENDFLNLNCERNVTYITGIEEVVELGTILSAAEEFFCNHAKPILAKVKNS